MENIKIFLDTDVIINWLCKEKNQKSNLELWESPYEILKIIETGKITGFTSLINLMEIIFVLRRKKKWGEPIILNALKKIQSIPNMAVLVPDESDMITSYNLQSILNLDPFDSIYYGMVKNISGYLISRDNIFIDIVNKAENREIAYVPENFLEFYKSSVKNSL